MQFWGTGNIENQYFDFRERVKMSIFQGNKGTGTSAPEGFNPATNSQASLGAAQNT